MPTEKPKQVLRAYDEYDKRSLVENKENRELKQGWFLLGWLSSRPAGYNLAELVAA
ncbi:MAG: hypothetical protein U9R11_01205 [Chloroflexota bacterium]|nr:hypothetical protein [Chloroflexota bacterium]